MDPLLSGDPENVGPYRLEGRLGEGGMGQVFLGRSPGGRVVAVKTIRREHAGNAQFRARFAREVEAARRVGGFHTAQVVDADPAADPPWLVTAFVPGPSLRQLVGEGGPLGPDAVRTLGARLAEGLAAIHGCGLVHRDLKPGNVIMAADGPRIIDFGIARAADASTLTSTGMVMGTYAFMSPEQIRADEAGTASDVFSLGCVLAYAATGHSPFEAGTIPAIVHLVINEPPRLGGVTGDLHDAIAACVAKDPADRPAVPDLITWLTTPGAVAAAPRAAAGPAPARPHPSPASRPGAPAPSATRQMEPPTVDLAGEQRPTALAPSPGRVNRRTLLLGAAAVAGTGAVVAVPAVLLRSRSGASGGFGGGDHPVAVESLAFSPDGGTLVSAGGFGVGAGGVWLCDVATGNSEFTRLGPAGDVGSVALSFDGKTLARSEGNSIRCWNTSTGSDVALTGHTGAIKVMAFNRDGTALASVGEDKTVRIWKLATRRTTATFRNTDTDALSSLAFSPDGALLAVGSSDGNLVRLLDAKSGRLKGSLNEGNYIRSVAFSPDSGTLAIGGSGTRLWTLKPGDPSTSLNDQTESGIVVAFGPGGRTLASGGYREAPGKAEGPGGGVRIWDVAGRRAITTLARATPPLAFSPDGATLATGGEKVQMWNAATGKLARTL